MTKSVRSFCWLARISVLGNNWERQNNALQQEWRFLIWALKKIFEITCFASACAAGHTRDIRFTRPRILWCLRRMWRRPKRTSKAGSVLRRNTWASGRHEQKWLMILFITETMKKTVNQTKIKKFQKFRYMRILF